MLIAVGALALTACTSEDVLDDVAKTSRNAIQFEYAINKSSRAEELTNTNLTEFRVFGFFTPAEDNLHAHNVFYNTPVTKDKVSGNWTYPADSVRYWVPGNEYYFYAYSCGTVAELNTDPDTGFGKFTVDMDDNTGEGKLASARELVINNYHCDYKHQHDLIFAYANQTGVEGNNDPVSFEFKHILSKLQARFTTSFSPEYTVVIKDVQIRNIYNQADFKNSVGWTEFARDPETSTPVVYLLDTNGDSYPKGDNGKPTKTDQELKVSNIKKEKHDAEGTKYEEQESVDSEIAFVIPNKYQTANVGFSFTIDLKYGDVYVFQNKQLSATLSPDWKKGCSYLYSIDINPDDLKMGTISFIVKSFDGWSTDPEFDGTIKPNPSSATN